MKVVPIGVALAALHSGVQAFVPFKAHAVTPVQQQRANPGRLATRMAEGAVGEPAFVPDMNRRQLMNSILLGSVGLSVLGLAVPYVSFFVPPSGSSAGGSLVAKDALGNDVTLDGWLSTHLPGDRSLVQGLKGDATYLIVKEDKTIQEYGLSAICTHLGCVVPWNKAENKFICPCHASQYDETGKVIRGPAPLSLALERVSVNDDGKIVFLTWTDTDMRTNEAPWWV